MYTSIKSREIVRPVSPKARHSSLELKNSQRRKRGRSAPTDWLSLNTPPHPQKPSKKPKTFLDDDDDDPPPQFALMTGWVMRKCLMEGARRKARQRTWKKCYLKLQHGHLMMQCSGRLSGQSWINPIKYYRHGSPRRSVSMLHYVGGNDDEESDDDDDDEDALTIDDGSLDKVRNAGLEIGEELY
jgi:hypothetical protein